MEDYSISVTRAVLVCFASPTPPTLEAIISNRRAVGTGKEMEFPSTVPTLLISRGSKSRKLRIRHFDDFRRCRLPLASFFFFIESRTIRDANSRLYVLHSWLNGCRVRLFSS